MDYYKKYFLDIAPIVYENIIPTSSYDDSETGLIAFSFNKDDVPIPISQGDIFSIKSVDYRIVSIVVSIQNNNKEEIFVCREINKKDNSEDYLKRVIEEEE